MAWTAFQANYTAFAVVTLFFAFSDPMLTLSGYEGSRAATNLVVPAIVNFVAHWTLLNGGRELDGPAMKRMGRWVWVKFTWLSLVLTLPSVVLLIVLTSGRGSAAPAALAAVLVFIATYAVTLALWGTVLPAIAATGRANLAEAGRRGTRTFFTTLRDLAAGPAAFTLALVATIIALATTGVPVAALAQADGGVSWIGTLVSVAVVLAALFGNALFAAVLCKAYYRGGGAA